MSLWWRADKAGGQRGDRGLFGSGNRLGGLAVVVVCVFRVEEFVVGGETVHFNRIQRGTGTRCLYCT